MQRFLNIESQQTHMKTNKSMPGDDYPDPLKDITTSKSEGEDAYPDPRSRKGTKTES
jgi:hypothetical protein